MEIRKIHKNWKWFIKSRLIPIEQQAKRMLSTTQHNKKMDKLIYKHKEIMLKETVIFHLQDIFKIKKQ